MNYLMVDISGKVLNYDIALCEALSNELSSIDQLKFFSANISPKDIECDCKKLISLIPQSLQNSENKVKRALKALEGMINYGYLIQYLLLHKVSILHLQWLPFLEICSIEKIFLKILRIVSPKTKIILTVHNLYPHNSRKSEKNTYRERFNKVQKYIDKFILHLNVSRLEFCRDFMIGQSRTCVIPHGVFEPKGLKVSSHVRGEKLNLIMYGNQSYYKGTDIFVDALNLLPEESKQKVKATIVGKIDKGFFQELKQKTEDLDVEWVPEFVPDDVLYRKIMESDVIVIPYREISQSGVLLLALNFNKAIIASDLPSFKETLLGIDNDSTFFENGNAKCLMNLIKLYVENNVDLNLQKEQISLLKHSYSWKNVAQKLINEVLYEGSDISK